MKSGLEGRNNPDLEIHTPAARVRLNEVRPRRPEQFAVNDVAGGEGLRSQ